MVAGDGILFELSYVHGGTGRADDNLDLRGPFLRTAVIVPKPFYHNPVVDGGAND